MSDLKFDVIVVGGGHAGCEAAAASARLGAKTALVTLDLSKVGTMSCNPAIGGIGKGHLVREIDALDGLMAKAIDGAGIQFRMLNASKGPAVRGPRSQADRDLYLKAIQRLLKAQPNLEQIEGEVSEVDFENGSCVALVLKDNRRIKTNALVLTTGTFLGGTIHIGEEVQQAGRMGENSSIGLSQFLRGLKLPMGRLKTGTPARLVKSSIDWDVLEKQAADPSPKPFSFLTDEIRVPQIDCAITHTNADTHAIIDANKHLSAIYSGAIQSTGPRYCPSIEDKITRFAGKDSHQVFLEPEGLDSDLVYPNGISTSLPRDVQDRYIRSIKGLERSEIHQYGYAVEYDYIDPRSLDARLALKGFRGFFLAGQINGTTGYEEAAGQGLMAGTNAALEALGSDQSLILERFEAYIGVMIDDLITRGAPEPYRMFTSRAEFRLTLRADNADQRLTDRGALIGLIGPERQAAWDDKKDRLEKARFFASSMSLSPHAWAEKGFRLKQDGKKRSLSDVASYLPNDCDQLFELFETSSAWDDEIKEQVAIDAQYAGYIVRQQADVALLQKESALKLSPDLDYSGFAELSTEERELLAKIRPTSLGQLSRIPGITAATAVTLAKYVQRH